MKKSTAIRTIYFEFECPYCDSLWVLGNDTEYDEKEQNYFNDLLEFGKTKIKCSCRKTFKVKVKEQ